MNFVKYPSLENHTNSKFIEKCFDAVNMAGGNMMVPFVAREKIHGTNFSVIITKDSIQAAKRSGPITETEKFFGYEDLMAELHDIWVDIQQLVIRNDWKSLQIFGEYAGGTIQKEVNYGEKSFYAFDILVDAPNFERDDLSIGELCDPIAYNEIQLLGGETFLNKVSNAIVNNGWWTDIAVEQFCDHFGIKIAPLILRGYLDDMLKLPVEFNSIVPTLTWDNMYQVHEQPKPTDNIAEGLVIKPNRPMWLPNGSRLAIKYKTDAFKEKGKGKAPKIPVPLPEADLELLSKFSEFATAARVRNVCSHIGEIDTKMFGKVLGLTMKDIFDEAEREGITINSAEMPSKLKGELQKIVSTTIREIWIDLIN